MDGRIEHWQIDPYQFDLYKGYWNASTNTPTLSEATKGEWYRVNVAGGEYEKGDDVWFNGESWVRREGQHYVIPTATGSLVGGVKIGSGITISNGVISVNTNYQSPITTGTVSQYFRGDLSLATFPSSLPASDVYDWAKASAKPTYTYDEVGAAPSSHKHYQLYQPDGSNAFIYADNSGQLHIDGNIIQNGLSYETHAEQVYTKKDYIILRDGATSGLANGSYAGFSAKKYDGVNDGHLVFDNTGTARVGDVGNEQPLTTRTETPADGYLAVWDNTNTRLNFIARSTDNISEGSTNKYYTESRVSANTDVAANTAARHSAVTLGTVNGLSLSGQQLSLGLASTSTTGALSSTDWNTFNSKQTAYTNLTSIGSLTNGSGFLKNNGSGTFSYALPTFSELISKPTTLAGYGITDAAPASGSANYVQVSPTSAQTGNIWMGGNVTIGGVLSLNATSDRLHLLNRSSANYLNGFMWRSLDVEKWYIGQLPSSDYFYLYRAGLGDILHFDEEGAATFSSSVTATQLQSSIATGTAPLTVASSTMVSNLNAELLGGYNSDYMFRNKYGINIDDSNSNLKGYTTSLGYGGATGTMPIGWGDGNIINLPGSQYTGIQLAVSIVGENTTYIRNRWDGVWGNWIKLQTALTNPITGTGTAGDLPVFTDQGSLGNSGILTNAHGASMYIDGVYSSTGGIIQLRDRYADGTNQTFAGIGISSHPGFDWTIGKFSSFTSGFFQIRDQASNVRFQISEIGDITLGVLSGTGTRIITASPTGQLGVVSGSGLVKSDGSVDSNSYLTGITSSQVTTALGYTPYNSTNPAGYITSSALSGYATQSWVNTNFSSYNAWVPYCNGVSGGQGVGNWGSMNFQAGSGISLSLSNLSLTISATDTNNYPTALAFSGGYLNLSRSGLSDLSVSLDGRYSLLSHTHDYSSVYAAKAYEGKVRTSGNANMAYLNGSDFLYGSGSDTILIAKTDYAQSGNEMCITSGGVYSALAAKAALAGSTSQEFSASRINLPGGAYATSDANGIIHLYPGIGSKIVVHGEVEASTFYKNT